MIVTKQMKVEIVDEDFDDIYGVEEHEQNVLTSKQLSSKLVKYGQFLSSFSRRGSQEGHRI